MSDNRQHRTEMLLGCEGMRRLHEASVMIVGLGAVGGYVLEALARAGVGRLILVDFDTFETTNINRQILALSSTLGRKKTEVAAARVHDINPDCRVETLDMFVNEESLPVLLAGKVDYVVDAIDSLNAKCSLLQALSDRGIPFITSMGAALKTDPSSIKCAPLSSSKNCALARCVRRRLRKRGVDISSVLSVFSDECSELPATALQMPEATDGKGRPRNIMGSLPTITAIFGLTLANEVILQLSGYKKEQI